MSDHSSDAVATLDDPVRPLSRSDARSSRSGISVPRSGARIPRSDWREGGRTVLRWRDLLLAFSLMSLGIAVLLHALLSIASPSTEGAIAGRIGLWIGMLVPIVWAFTTSRPAGLLRFRWMDVLWGVGFALLLRLAQGWLAIAFGGSGALPSYPLTGGGLAPTWWFTDLVAPVAVAPVIEEFFFRAVVLVAIFTVLRRSLGRPLAGVIAVLVSSAAFALVTLFGEGASADQAVTAGILSIVCGTLVVLTGRIWGAVLVHMLYSSTFIALAAAGTLLA